MQPLDTAASRAKKSFLDAVNACAALNFGASATDFVRAYNDAFDAARGHQPWLSEAYFRESFFRSTARWFGGAADSRYEQSIAQHVVLQGRRALAHTL